MVDFLDWQNDNFQNLFESFWEKKGFDVPEDQSIDLYDWLVEQGLGDEFEKHCWSEAEGLGVTD